MLTIARTLMGNPELLLLGEDAPVLGDIADASARDPMRRPAPDGGALPYDADNSAIIWQPRRARPRPLMSIVWDLQQGFADLRAPIGSRRSDMRAGQGAVRS